MIYIRKKLEASGKTLTQLAAELCVSVVAASNWAAGVKMPAADKLPAIAKALGCTVDELYEED